MRCKTRVNLSPLQNGSPLMHRHRATARARRTVTRPPPPSLPPSRPSHNQSPMRARFPQWPPHCSRLRHLYCARYAATTASDLCVRQPELPRRDAIDQGARARRRYGVLQALPHRHCNTTNPRARRRRDAAATPPQRFRAAPAPPHRRAALVALTHSLRRRAAASVRARRPTTMMTCHRHR